ncbi:MAG: ammonia-forming cytochrome c nitrite reductase subunit c552, partial [Planctomycetes bacterium]|nr:ammonia-forming cytochrome c nitrite reductase subunit c552 [Planctomycetota bacterium]
GGASGVPSAPAPAPAPAPARPAPAPGSAPPSGDLAGSASCRECHADFYRKWETSRHGLAMRVVDRAFVASLLAPAPGPVAAGKGTWTVDLAPFPPVLREEGAGGGRAFPLAHALGGKNVFYFLTPLERGRLQVLPLAYDVKGRRWYDAAATMTRHAAETPVDWRDPLLTFNTSCHSCHVSQLATNYDEATDSYRTTWAEPGISCETCHNSGREHVEAMRAAAGGPPPADLRILRYRGLDHASSTATCSACHAKARPLGTAYRAGDPFFDHYDLAALEDPDFHPDGRDLGENYTMTSWYLSPCVQSGTLDCLHCHTSSGRYRFTGEEANRACAPCHETRVADAPAHHRHAPGTPGSRCVDCHMPKTRFAGMERSDHSMRPPMPAATARFGSPNACNLCHADRDAAWADRTVREWHAGDFQAETLRWAGWIEAARRGEWKALPEIVAYLADRGRQPVVAASLARLLVPCPDPSVDRALAALLEDVDPLVRAAAAEALAGRGSAAGVAPLLSALEDGTRAVRMRAVAGLAGVPPAALPEARREALEAAEEEYLASLRTRPDQWDAHLALGNWSLGRGDARAAAAAFDRASVLRPDTPLPLVNGSIALARLGDAAGAETRLRRAVALAPGSAPARFNLGLLLAEKGDTAGAERELRAALAADPSLDGAAFNLGVLLAERAPEESIRFCREALRLRPASARYAFTLAFYLRGAGRRKEAAGILERAIEGDPPEADLYSLLADLRLEAGDPAAARRVLLRAAANLNLPAGARADFKRRVGEGEGR